MKNYFQLILIAVFISFSSVAQKPIEQKITISGKVFEKGNKIAVEYARNQPQVIYRHVYKRLY